MAVEYMVCEKCGRRQTDKNFFKTKSGERYPMCKSCLTSHIDNRSPDTFLWILEEFDVPYIEDVWIPLVNKIYLKNPQKFNGASVIGTYIRMMGMHQYNSYGYADTERIAQEKIDAVRKQREYREQQAKSRGDYEDRLLERLENGEISQAQYETLSYRVAERKKEDAPHVEYVSVDEQLSSSLGKNADEGQDDKPKFVAPVGLDESQIQESLTEEDMKYLALKWGMLYKPSEWVKLEETYQKYAAEYELNVDREEVLQAICKTSLKMNQMLDVGDIKSYRDLSAVYDQLRKSAKFTESQNKEQATRELDSIGELVKFVESEGGIIPHYESPIEYPKDKIDFIIKDLKNYTVNLVKNELGLGDLIESFIEKVKENKTKSAEQMVNEGFTSVTEDLRQEQEAREYQASHIEDVEEESKKLVEQYGA